MTWIAADLRLAVVSTYASDQKGPLASLEKSGGAGGGNAGEYQAGAARLLASRALVLPDAVRIDITELSFAERMLMMLDIADALSLILERSGRRAELQIPTMLALLYTRRSLWRRRDSYPKRLSPNRNGRNHGVGRGVDDRDSA